MSTKVIKYGEEARAKIKTGIDNIANAVKVTLGPKGRNVIINNPLAGAPIITKDGVTVAREIKFKDQFEDAGAQLIKEVAQKTADVAGDGTTTATVLAQAIFTEGVSKGLATGANPMFLKKGIDLAMTAAVAAIRDISSAVSVSGLHDVASISANNDKEIGTFIADAMNAAGKDGVITVEESKTMESRIETVEGLELSRGYLSSYFVNNPTRMTCEYDDCRILVTDKKLSNIMLLVPMLNLVAQASKPLLIIAEDVDGTALSGLLVNTLRKTLQACAIKSPLYGDYREKLLEDIAILTGGTFISDKLGKDIDKITLSDLGTAGKVIVSKDATTIVNGGGKKDDILARINLIRSQLGSEASSFEKEKLQERLAKLSGGIVVISIGAITETEMKEKKARVEDALHATRAAVDEGIVPGGGVAYIRAIESVKKLLNDTMHDDIKMGIRSVLAALTSPLWQICKNAGVSPEIVIAKIQSDSNTIETPHNYGYDALNDVYGDLTILGVIDPTKVTVSALYNAASVASLLLTTDAVICDEPEEKNNETAQPGYPGMM